MDFLLALSVIIFILLITVPLWSCRKEKKDNKF